MEIILLKRRPFPSPPLKRLRRWIETVMEHLSLQSEGVGVLFCGPRTMRRYQRSFRNRDTVTDVLSFPGDTEAYLGDIVICVDRAKEQAKELGHSLERELKRLLLHGILHCAGWDHERDEGQMAALEEKTWGELA